MCPLYNDYKKKAIKNWSDPVFIYEADEL